MDSQKSAWNSNWPLLTASTVASSSSIAAVSVDSALFLHGADHPGLILIPHQLTGPNYLPWRRAMEVALGAKSKLQFINGDLQMPAKNDATYDSWRRVDWTVLSWILNTLSKELSETFVYAYGIHLISPIFFSHRLLHLAVQLKEPLLCSVGPAFFAAAKNVPAGSLNTPFTVVAAGMAKWLDLYSGVLMVRVLLSWFPNIPWDRQPLSAIRDLCDPYLNLFRNIIPPIFDTLDVSPLLAFAVLGTLGSILNSSRQAS